MESYYEKHICCDWCGYSTRGRIEDNKVLCTSCQLPLIDNGKCVGLITIDSILNSKNAKKVKEAMINPPPIISEDEIITSQIRVFLFNSPCILVFHKNSTSIKGIITEWDLLDKLYD